MKSRTIFVAGSMTVIVTVGAALLGACATNEDATLAPVEDEAYDIPSADASVFADADGAGEPCADCEFFPATCTDDVLCPIPAFDPANPASLIDPRGAVLNIRGRGANDVWLTGVVGMAAHFDGAAWTMSDLGAGETQRVLWVREQNEISFSRWNPFFARGAGVEPGDGGISPGGWVSASFTIPSSVRSTDLGVVESAWARSDSDLLWVGTSGTCGIWRVRAASPTELQVAASMSLQSCTLHRIKEVLGIHGASSDAVWAVGGRGLTLRVGSANDETPTYKLYDSLTTNALRGVWAASDDDVWAVGASGTIRHYTGDPRVWEVIDGVPTNETLNAVWGTSSTDVWAVGNAGVVLHYDGTRWSRVKVAGAGAEAFDLYTVWSSGPGRVWIGGQGVVLSLGGKP